MRVNCRPGLHAQTSPEVPSLTVPMFRHRQQLRRWAAAVMLLLLFGLGAGVANACVVGTLAAAGHREGPAHASGPLHHAHPADAQAGQDAPAPLAGVHCQDFCAKAALSILPLKSALDDVHAAALITKAPAAVLPVPAFAAAPAWPLRRDGAPAPRILITFLRLAL
jgi:hypothetical protein